MTNAAPAQPAVSANAEMAVEVRSLRYAYAQQVALALEHFALARGVSSAIMGPSGCGKSTFVHLLAGLLTPEAGSIHILGQDLSLLNESQRDRFRGRHIGFVFQRLHLMPALSIRENIALAQRLARAPRDTQRIDDILETLGLADMRHRRPRELSQGQAQRAAIARALVHEPELVIADEPTSALDDDHAAEALGLLQRTATASGAALLVVTHDDRVRGKLDGEFAMEVPA